MTKKKNIVHYTSDEIKQMPFHEHEVDWERVNALTDEDIEQAISSDPDTAPIWTKESLKKATLMMPESDKKPQITIKVNSRTLEWFKSRGKGYQSRINAVLDAYVTSMENHQSI
jgi:uncharacterized protein (DUF4415 family)